MTWARIDDGLYDDPRTEAAGLDAMGLWALANSYMGAYNTDGSITRERVKKIAGRRAPALAARLVAAGFWEATPDGWQLLGWEGVLVPRAEVERRSAGARVAGAKGGRARASKATDHEPGTLPPDNSEQTPEISPTYPRDNPSDRSPAQNGNSAINKRIDQPTPAHVPEPDPVPVSARMRARDISDPPVLRPRPSGSLPLLADLCDPPTSEPSKLRRRSRPEPAPKDPGTLDARARAAYDVIAADVSLRPICLGAVQLARDLCAIGKLVDVAHEVEKAGAWMRGDPGDPRRRKTRGNAFLSNWITRAQERAAREAPARAPSIVTDLSLHGPRPGKPPPVSKTLQALLDIDAATVARGEPTPAFDPEAALQRLVQHMTPREPEDA